MRDFILDKIKKKRSIYESISNEAMRDFMVLMKREYLIRLMLAILWDAYYVKCSNSEKSRVVKLLFEKKPSLGDFVSAMRILCKYSPQKRLYEKICDKTCRQPIYNRNQDAHKISAQNDQMICVIDKWVEGILEEGYHLFSDSDTDNSYNYCFMIPLRETGEERVQCICFGMGGNYTTPIMEAKLFKKGMGQLYYYVENCITEEKEAYKLSPFIHYFDDPVNGTFTLYNSTISKLNNKLVIEARSLFDERLSDKREDVILSEKSCRLSFEADFPMTHVSENFYISTFNNVMVNRSSYHMFKEVANNKFKYTESVAKDYCDRVDRFCEDRKSQPFLVIAGGGGLGKTALLLNVIQKIMGNELEKADYDLIIFLSAKQNYLEDRTTKTLKMTQVTDSDIVDFKSFKYKLWKYVFDFSDEEMAEKYPEAEGAEAKGIQGQEKSILLMVDDLDMLVPDDQEEICRFVKSIPASKMKSIIATRNVNTNGEKIEMQRLDQDKCVKFAKWVIENGWEEEGRFWLEKLEEERYQNSVFRLSRGIPVFVQKWVRMLVENVNLLDIDNIFTERDCIKYLYCTVKNQLKPKEAQMIYLIKETCRLCKIRVYESFFLYTLCSVETEDELNQCLRSLISFQLIQGDADSDSIYSLFDFDYSCIEIGDGGYYESEIYRKIFKSMEKSPGVWRNRTEYLTEIIQCLGTLSEYDASAALLLDKLCSDYGTMNCTVPQSRELMGLQHARDAMTDMDAELADILGRWDGRTYDTVLMGQILDRMWQDSFREETLDKALCMIVDCCERQADEAEKTADEADPWIREFAEMWKKMKKIENPSEKMEAAKKRFVQKLRGMENW